MELLWEAGLDALLDSLKMLPFLYLAYWLIEAVERSHGARIERILAQGGKWGFLAGGVLGCLPQCGFSAMAANLYASRVISLGTLMAVFVATSDEAVPMLLSMPCLLYTSKGALHFESTFEHPGNLSVFFCVCLRRFSLKGTAHIFEMPPHFVVFRTESVNSGNSPVAGLHTFFCCTLNGLQHRSDM